VLDLTPREFEVLAYLMRHANKVVTHRLLLAEVWGPQYEGETQYLRVFINRLRRKIEDDPSHPRIIVTEPGIGYRLLPAST
jgi:two-component system KDP operon response regulator KdpE